MTLTTDQIEADINRSRHALNDTIEQLGGKLSPGQIVDEALGLFQGQAGKLTTNLGRQIRDNPLPLLLVGAGLAMLFLHKKGDHPNVSSGLSPGELAHETRYRNLEAARSGVVRAADETESAWSHRLHEVEARALDLKQHAGEAIDAFKARVKDASDAFAKTAAGIRDRLYAGVNTSAHFVGDQVHNLKGAAGEATRKTADIYGEYPLAAGAIGVAIGALIGAMAPLSSFERDNLQGIADAAAKAGAGLADKGASAVERIAEKAANALH